MGGTSHTTRTNVNGGWSSCPNPGSRFALLLTSETAADPNTDTGLSTARKKVIARRVTAIVHGTRILRVIFCIAGIEKSLRLVLGRVAWESNACYFASNHGLFMVFFELGDDALT